MQASPIESVDQLAGSFSSTLVAERAWLVRLCAGLTGSSFEAEDLAQEALLEAWRARGKLRDIDAIKPWLSAIARNVYLRYRRHQGQESGHLTSCDPDMVGVFAGGMEDAPLTLAQEDSDVATVLSRALATLPLSIRQALEAVYVEERPQAELARAMQITESALRVRLHRGKRALKQALTGPLRIDAIASGLMLPEATGWTTTRTWCPWCGLHHLELHLDDTNRRFAFRCSGACDPQLAHICAGKLPDDLASPKSILSRLCLSLGTDYRRALATGSEGCPRCGIPVRITRWPFGDEHVDLQVANGIQLRCDKCAIFDTASPWHMALDTSEAQRFWRRCPRMRAIPVQATELNGRAVLVTGFESVVGNERLEIISACDTYELLHVARGGGWATIEQAATI
jgi:RNA polymerase sigma-70 factor (ECF subfamily)